MNNKIWVPRKQVNQINSNRGISTSITTTNNIDNSTNITTLTVQETGDETGNILENNYLTSDTLSTSLSIMVELFKIELEKKEKE